MVVIITKGNISSMIPHTFSLSKNLRICLPSCPNKVPPSLFTTISSRIFLFIVSIKGSLALERQPIIDEMYQHFPFQSSSSLLLLFPSLVPIATSTVLLGEFSLLGSVSVPQLICLLLLSWHPFSPLSPVYSAIRKFLINFFIATFS